MLIKYEACVVRERDNQSSSTLNRPLFNRSHIWNNAASIVLAQTSQLNYYAAKPLSPCRSRSRLSRPLVRLAQPRTTCTRGNSQISCRILRGIATPADSGICLLIISIRVEPSVARVDGGTRPGRGKGRSRHGNRSTSLSILREERHGVGSDIGERGRGPGVGRRRRRGNRTSTGLRNNVSLSTPAHFHEKKGKKKKKTYTTSHVGIGESSIKVVHRHAVCLTGTSNRSRVYRNCQQFPNLSGRIETDTYLWGSIPSRDRDGSARMGWAAE